MKLSNLIKQLILLKEREGDVDVTIADAVEPTETEKILFLDEKLNYQPLMETPEESNSVRLFPSKVQIVQRRSK